MLSLGLIGLGRHGRRYADHLIRGDVAGARLAGFWRRDQAQAADDARALGVPAFPTPEGLIEAADAVVIVVPAAEHVRLARLVGAQKKPLLIEKPLARNATEGREIIDAVERAMVAQTIRFDPLTVLLREHQTGLGRLRGFGLEQRIEPRGLAWENDVEVAGGGVLVQTGIHAIDALRFITGARVSVEHAAFASVLGGATEDQAWLRLRAGDVRGDLRTSKIGRGRRHRYTFFFDDGILESDYIARTFDDGRTLRSVPAVPTVVRTLEAFARWVTEGGDCPVPLEEALDAVAIADAAYRGRGPDSGSGH